MFLCHIWMKDDRLVMKGSSNAKMAKLQKVSSDRK